MHHKAPFLNPHWQSARKTVISHPFEGKITEVILKRLPLSSSSSSYCALTFTAMDDKMIFLGGILYLKLVNVKLHCTVFMRFRMQKLKVTANIFA